MFGAIHLKNFRCFEDTSIDFKNGRGVINSRVYLFGDNASGKTSILQAFLFLKQNLTSLADYKDFGRSFKQVVRRNFRHNAKDDLILIYEFSINKQRHIYEVVYNQEMELTSESLVRVKSNHVEVLFTATPQELNLNSNMYIIDDFDRIHHYYKKYFGDYSFLSILYYASNRKFVKLKIGAYNVLNFINRGVYSIDRTGPYHINILNGRADENLKFQLEEAKSEFSVFISSIFNTVAYIDFDFIRNNDGTYDYRLKVYGSSKGGTYLMQPDDMPHSLYSFLQMLVDLLSLFNGTIGIFDYFDHALDIHSLTAMIQFIEETIEGQLFIAFNSLDIINALKPSDIFISSQDEVHNHFVVSLQQYAPTQTNHNVRKRYEEGLYSSDLPVYQRSKLKVSKLKKSLEAINRN